MAGLQDRMQLVSALKGAIDMAGCIERQLATLRESQKLTHEEQCYTREQFALLGDLLDANVQVMMARPDKDDTPHVAYLEKRRAG